MAPKKRKQDQELGPATPKAKSKPASRAAPKSTPKAVPKARSKKGGAEVLSEMTAPFPCKNVLEMMKPSQPVFEAETVPAVMCSELVL